MRCGACGTRLGERQRDADRDSDQARARHPDNLRLSYSSRWGSFRRSYRPGAIGLRSVVRGKVRAAVLDVVRATRRGAPSCRALILTETGLNLTSGWWAWCGSTANSPRWSY